ncbi:DUF1254 domain-containing protein [Pandoraea sp. PE-S2T-3]|uniref:DUF1254 domain-containing protein n=1 Tax=Pandoraea sp. PE-S2T-3 TaxID=1986993 RepID=UPI001C3C644B|nr:DUF1254 domain-containing protein [Pandoraea sp. PE-S2T-3]
MFKAPKSMTVLAAFTFSVVGTQVHGAPEALPFGNVQMDGTLPARSAVPGLFAELDFQQATQAYLWALPLVAYAQWQKESYEKLGAKPNDLVVYTTWKDKLGILTANATTPYILGFSELDKSGPLVIDMPAGPTAGGVGDFWQRSMIDMGQTGPDKGRGGKYLILPPGVKAPADAKGYYVAQSQTNNVLLGFRVLEPDPAKAKAIVSKIKVYSYRDRQSPPNMRLVSPDGRDWSGTQPDGMAYWQRLHEIIQREPVNERDRFYMAMLANLGIEKGKSFNPDERQRKALEQGATAGKLLAQTNTYAKRFENVNHWPDRRWEYALFIKDPSQRVANYDQLLERTAWFYEAVTDTKGMISSTPGLGQAYLGAYTDKNDTWLDGGKNYKLRVAANPPAKQFWSLTVYDTDTRRFVENSKQKSDVSSRENLRKNADGSVDLYFGPNPPPGEESNWVQTVAGKHWFAYFRLYGPTEAYFDKRWKMEDITAGY